MVKVLVKFVLSPVYVQMDQVAMHTIWKKLEQEQVLQLSTSSKIQYTVLD